MMNRAPARVKRGDDGSQWPLHGRQQQLEFIQSVLLQRPRRSVVLCGPAGVGKTRLAREAIGLAKAAGLNTHWLVATQSTMDVPYGALATLLPAAYSETIAGPTDLLRRSVAALASLGGDRGLILGVDDAHLLDRASAGLLQQLVAAESVSIVATIRARTPVPEELAALLQADFAVRVDLDGIPAPAVLALLTDVLGDYVDPATAAELWGRCEGNLLMLRELVRAALANGSLDADLGLWRLSGQVPQPDSLIELIEKRLRSLDTRSRELLELVAYGEPLGRAELEAAGDSSLAAELERSGLIVSEMVGRRLLLRPAHPTYGEVVRRLTPAVRTVSMARSLAETIEACGARRREDVLRVGILRLDCGGGSTELMRAAAETARWRYDFGLAERLARAAIELRPDFEAALLAAQCRALQGGAAQAVAEMKDLGPLSSNDDQRTRLAIALVDTLWLNLGEMSAAKDAAEQAERSITDAEFRREVAGRRAALLLGTDGPRSAAELADPLIRDARGRGLAWIGVTGAFALGRLGRINDALAAASRAHDASIELAAPFSWYPWFALFTRCEALAQSGRYTEARQLAEEQYERGLEAGSIEARVFFLWHLARTAHDTGHPEAAARRAREGIALCHEIGYQPLLQSLRAVLVTALALSGARKEARKTLTALLESGISQPQWSQCDLMFGHAWVCVSEGALGEARAILADVVDYGVERGDLAGAATALHDIARLGRPDSVDAQLSSLAKSFEGDLVQARARHVRALAHKDGNALEAVAATFDACGAHLLAAEAAADAASQWSRLGDTRRLSAAQQRAAVLRARCGDAVTPALATIDLPSRLTPAELETALLAVAGHSNRDIALRLQLSDRTVGNRLQRVYEKLGVSSRTELGPLLR